MRILLKVTFLVALMAAALSCSALSSGRSSTEPSSLMPRGCQNGRLNATWSTGYRPYYAPWLWDEVDKIRESLPQDSTQININVHFSLRSQLRTIQIGNSTIYPLSDLQALPVTIGDTAFGWRISAWVAGDAENVYISFHNMPEKEYPLELDDENPPEVISINLEPDVNGEINLGDLRI